MECHFDRGVREESVLEGAHGLESGQAESVPDASLSPLTLSGYVRSIERCCGSCQILVMFSPRSWGSSRMVSLERLFSHFGPQFPRAVTLLTS